MTRFVLWCVLLVSSASANSRNLQTTFQSECIEGALFTAFQAESSFEAAVTECAGLDVDNESVLAAFRNAAQFNAMTEIAREASGEAFAPFWVGLSDPNEVSLKDTSKFLFLSEDQTGLEEFVHVEVGSFPWGPNQPNTETQPCAILNEFGDDLLLDDKGCGSNNFFICSSNCVVDATNNPSESPSTSPTSFITAPPTKAPTALPTRSPTESPSAAPTLALDTEAPTAAPTSALDTEAPTAEFETEAPTISPTINPTSIPTEFETNAPTNTLSPTAAGADEDDILLGFNLEEISIAIAPVALIGLIIIVAISRKRRRNRKTLTTLRNSVATSGDYGEDSAIHRKELLVAGLSSEVSSGNPKISPKKVPLLDLKLQKSSGTPSASLASQVAGKAVLRRNSQLSVGIQVEESPKEEPALRKWPVGKSVPPNVKLHAPKLSETDEAELDAILGLTKKRRKKKRKRLESINPGFRSSQSQVDSPETVIASPTSSYLKSIMRRPKMKSIFRPSSGFLSRATTAKSLKSPRSNEIKHHDDDSNIDADI